ncbi:MAG TPA: AsmA-like C-terminal region-containing protein [Nitrospiraceae bacterium]|nr:AsmA-like C-terminal region-containing protein [Nitrospiraceae bacterium]
MMLGIVAILFLAVGILAFPLLYDPNAFKQLLLDQVEQQIGRKIEVREARLEVFPRIHLELFDVVIRDADPAHVFFQAERLDLVLRAYSLLRQQIVGKRLVVERPRLALRRDSEGQWNFQPTGVTHETASDENGVMGNPLALLMLVKESTVTDGQVTITDEFRSDGVRSLDIHGVDAKIAVGQKGQQADVQISGAMASPGGASEFSMDGRIEERETASKLAVDEVGVPAHAMTFEGTAEASNVDIRQVAEFFGPRPVPERLHGTMDMSGQVSLVPGIVGYDMVVSKMKATIGHLAINGHASVSGLMAEQPTFSVSFSSSPVSLDELMTRFPVQWVSSQLQMMLIERDIGGVVEVVTATVIGSTTSEPQMSLTGEFKVTQGRMLVGQDRTPVQHLSGALFVEPDRLRVTELNGMYGLMRITGGKALVSALESIPWLDLEVKGDVAIADLVAVLAKSIRVPKVAGAFAELTEIKGQSQVALHIAGPVKESDTLQIVRAEVIAQDIWFRTPLVNERIVDLNGRFLYSKTGVEFDKLAGRLGRTSFEVGGGISFGEPSLYQDFTVRARGDLAQLLRLVEMELPSSMTWQGVTSALATFGGPVSAPKIKGLVDIKDTEFTMIDWVRKPTGTPAAVEFEGVMGQDSTLSIERLELVLPPFRLATKGKVRLTGGLALDATFVSGPVSVAGLPQGMTVGPLKDGIVEVSLDVKGKGNDWHAWQINGWVALTGGLVVPTGVDTVSDLYVRAKIVRTSAEIKRLAFKIKDSDVRMSGMVRNWNRNPFFNIDIESAQLDIDLLIPKGKRSPIRDFLETLAETSRVVATVSIDHGIYKTLDFHSVTSRLNIRGNVLDIDRISGDTDDGHLAGRVVVFLPPQKSAELEVSFRLSGLPVEKLLQLTRDESRMMSGSLSANGSVRGNEGDSLGFVHSLDGKTDFMIEDGRVQKGRVIPKIITILNLPTLLQGKVDLGKDGLPFDKIVGSFTLSNGILTEDNLVIDSPVMKMSAAGNYDIAADHLDAVVVVSPFGSYSQLLKSIPLFGKLFKGEREGTALFEVKGTLQSPDVNYLPLRSFAKGITGLAQLAFDMLRNTIMLPKEIIAPSDEPSSDGARSGKDRPEPRLP